MHLRLDHASKRTLERAAAYENTSVSRFVVNNAVSVAEKVIERRECVSLSSADWEAFYEALADPPEPNAALKEAVRRNRSRVRG